MPENSRCQNADSSPAGMFSAALLILGTAVGAGILGVPVVAGLTGALPSFCITASSWLLMTITGWILVRRLVHYKRPGLDITSLYRMELGVWGARIASLTYLFLFHILMVAFLSGAGAVLSRLLSRPEDQVWFILIFFATAGSLVLFGPELVRRCNALLMFLLAASFILLLGQCERSFDASRLAYQDWIFLPGALPLIICAFGYHNIVPLTCTMLNYNTRRIGTALILGTGLVFLFNAAWITAVIGALPLKGPGEANLLAAYHQNQPATVPLAMALKSSITSFLGMLFSMAAITTSYVAVGLGLVGFLRDLWTTLGKNPNRYLSVGTALLPSLVISLLWPNLFLHALNLVGGVCLIVLFGIMPALMLYLRRSGTKRLTAGLLLALFCLLLLLELLQEAGLLLIRPEWDHWVIAIPGLTLSP